MGAVHYVAARSLAASAGTTVASCKGELQHEVARDHRRCTNNGSPNDDAQFWGAFSTDRGLAFTKNIQISAGASNSHVRGTGLISATTPTSPSTRESLTRPGQTTRTVPATIRTGRCTSSTCIRRRFLYQRVRRTGSMGGGRASPPELRPASELRRAGRPS